MGVLSFEFFYLQIIFVFCIYDFSTYVVIHKGFSCGYENAAITNATKFLTK